MLLFSRLTIIILYVFPKTFVGYILVNPYLLSSETKSSIILHGIRQEINFEPNQIEILRVLGRVDIVTESEYTADVIGMKNGEEEISIRIFEARLYDGTKCFLKEYSPTGLTFGKREQSISRKLLTKWVQIHNDANNTKNNITTYSRNNEESESTTSNKIRYLTPIDDMSIPYFPVLLGSLITDFRIENNEFRSKWLKRFPSVRPPESGNLWLIFQWSDATFRNLKRYPNLPQIIQGLDYFNKNSRIKKRWIFIRKTMRLILETVDKLHRIHGYCHNSLSTECIWLTTTNQLEIKNVQVVLSELGTSQKLVDLGPYAKKGVFQDLYCLGYIFFELIISSFVEDNIRRGVFQC